jgi:hypothetical protein
VLETGETILEKLAVNSQKVARSGCTGLSGGAPDSVWCARLAAVNWLLSGLRRRCTAINHRTVRWCTGLSGEPTVGRVIRARRMAGPTVRRGHRTVSGVHQAVSGAPTALNLQRSASPKKERNPHRTVSDGAPDCPVRQATEGKNCLLGMLLTTPSCLGAIKGTSRHMEEHTKHSLSIHKHQDSNFAHSILCDSN